jgi:hypothetical protein
MTCGMTFDVRPGLWVRSVLWVVLSVQMGAVDALPGPLVMRRSWVRFPQAAPTFLQVRRHFARSSSWLFARSWDTHHRSWMSIATSSTTPSGASCATTETVATSWPLEISTR